MKICLNSVPSCREFLTAVTLMERGGWQTTECTFCLFDFCFVVYHSVCGCIQVLRYWRKRITKYGPTFHSPAVFLLSLSVCLLLQDGFSILQCTNRFIDRLTEHTLHKPKETAEQRAAHATEKAFDVRSSTIFLLTMFLFKPTSRTSQYADENHDGQISLTEFMNWVRDSMIFESGVDIFCRLGRNGCARRRNTAAGVTAPLACVEPCLATAKPATLKSKLFSFPRRGKEKGKKCGEGEARAVRRAFVEL